MSAAPAFRFPEPEPEDLIDPLRGHTVEEARQIVTAAVLRSDEITKLLQRAGKGLPREMLDQLTAERSSVEWEGYTFCAGLDAIGEPIPDEALRILEHCRYEAEMADARYAARNGDLGIGRV